MPHVRNKKPNGFLERPENRRFSLRVNGVMPLRESFKFVYFHKNLMELLEKLVNAHGPSGHEQAVRNLIMHEIKPFVDEVYVDKFGNLVAHKKGKGPRVMIAAHMDEIGLMAKQINPRGHIKFAIVGGIEPLTLIGQRVDIISQHREFICNGVITTEALQDDEPTDEIPSIHDLYVDTGLDKKSLEKLGVGIGTYIIPKHNFRFLGNKKIISGKALDDRLGCYILIKVAEKLKRSTHEVFFVFTVQEEIGLYGARTSVYKINPDWAIAVDVTNTGDAYDPVQCVLGGGPTLTIMDSEMISNFCVNDWLLKIGKKNHIPIQQKVEEVGTTDATRMMLSRGGVPSTVVGVPIRNIHSPIGIANMDDITNCIKLLYLLLKNPPNVCLV